MRWTLVGAMAGVAMLCIVSPLRASEPLDMYDTEAAALKHCGGDAVVWLDVPAHTYWLKDQPGYGSKPRDGGYTCRRNAVRAGNRVSRN